jgi:hypothetical protein
LNYWTKRRAILQLSGAGNAIFAGVFGTSSIEVDVEWADDLGLWIYRDQVDASATSVMLIRWSHFDTAFIDVVLPEQKRATGFTLVR